eukprot:m.340006 g.340006  ORF g.340006 m.340006 type:complete len:50 (-) comp19076_c0_seq1:153-302(-)
MSHVQQTTFHRIRKLGSNVIKTFDTVRILSIACELQQFPTPKKPEITTD